MIYVLFDKDGNVTGYTSYKTSYPATTSLMVQSRWDWKSKERVDEIAAELSKITGKHFIGIDAGSSVSPRYDIKQVPQVGDEVSSYFNGDAYPEGKIASISKSLKVITLENGKRFYRRRQTGAWINNGTWSLIMGVHNERNPHI